MSADDRRANYAATLRRIADLTESGVLPMPSTAPSFSLWFRESENGRQLAAVAAEALALTWTAERTERGTYGSPYHYLRSAPPELGVHFALYLSLDETEPEPVTTPPPAAVAFADELNAAAGGAA